jgi:hypothetical protein
VVPACASFKNGFLVSISEGGLVTGSDVLTAAVGTDVTTSGTGGGGGDTSFRSNS